MIRNHFTSPRWILAGLLRLQLVVLQADLV
jgi:hypothetical protein